MEYRVEKVRYISHEVKNQISVCDLYAEIMQRYCEKNEIVDEILLKSISNIKRALKMAGNTLLELKSADVQEIAEYNIKDILSEGCELSSIYGQSKEVVFSLNCTVDENVNIDKNRFEGVIINLIKNACEAFDDNVGNWVRISAEREDSIIKIIVSNNAKPIENIDIFAEGVTTKENGSGLGLYISRQNMEEMGGSLRLLKSDENSTDFEIRIK